MGIRRRVLRSDGRVANARIEQRWRVARRDIEFSVNYRIERIESGNVSARGRHGRTIEQHRTDQCSR